MYQSLVMNKIKDITLVPGALRGLNETFLPFKPIVSFEHV
ncbi:hypothetical protein HMPREF9446_03486 [Bacteroides fluxus YIT 12057]|uniref:Uncharacterized protein n=1 Tax=Bacteroides fluxus YIT 12057 TaxID=763034 RepID=F3PXI7_9BACE|nr:hypothetical protein HMPREF9446_03486 [Bacteroides fluxus YIT 12057]